MEIKIKSSVQPYVFVNSTTLLQNVALYKYVAAWFLDEVIVQYSSDFRLDNQDSLLELRAFDVDKELHLVKAGTEWKGRIRQDGDSAFPDGCVTEIFDEEHLLWGMPADKGVPEGYTFLTEDRGTQLTLPIIVSEGKRAFMKVRNYLSNDHFEFVDYRFVDFAVKEAKAYGEE